MSVQSWQIGCPRCGWSNSGAEKRCMKCGQPLRTAPGLLVAGESGKVVAAPEARPRRVVQPGGFFPRLIAVIIDAFILSVTLVPIFYLWLGTKGVVHLDPAGTQANPFIEQLRALGGSSLSAYTPDQLLSLVGFYVGTDILVLFYFVGTWSILGGSPGQLVMSLRVVDKSAQGIGFGRALMRYFWKGTLGWLAPASALMVALGKEKRAIHDLLAGTYVIQFLDDTVAEGATLPPAQAGAPTSAPPASAGIAPGATAVVTAVTASEPTAAPAPVATAPPAPTPPAAPAVEAPGASSFGPYPPAPVAPATEAYAPVVAATAALASAVVTPPAVPEPVVAAPLQPPSTAPAAPASVPAPPSQVEPSPASFALSAGLYEPPPMALPPLPPPTPAAASTSNELAEPATSTALEAGPRRATTELEVEPYPLPFAPLPPVVHAPSSAPRAASDQRSE